MSQASKSFTSGSTSEWGVREYEDLLETCPEFKDLTREQAIERLTELLGNRRWRLDNLYYITDEKGRKIRFNMNYAQKLLFLGFHYCNIILKSRQHGITTFMCILFLDTALFNSNTHCCIIAHNKEDAQDFFRKKIIFAYRHLPIWLKWAIPSAQESTNTLSFDNGSAIRVTTSGRSGTYQMVHISEFGKMCAKYPHKAEEVITGTLNAIHAGQIVTIESTAEGQEGKFHDMCQEAMKAQAEGLELGPLDFKFFFFGANENELNKVETPRPIPDRLVKYFDTMEGKLGVRFTDNFKWWYVSKERVQGDLMKREHPMTPEEAFEASLEGAYYATQMMALRKRGQIDKIPHKEALLVHTFWDLGYNDINSIWFAQQVGREVHVIHYYQNSGEGLLHYADYCRGLAEDRGYRYGQWYAPHDIVVHEYTSGKTRLDSAAEMGIKFQVSERISKDSQIQLVRSVLPVCYFDRDECEKGIAALDAYRKEWNDALGVWKDKPRHDWASNGADAFAVLAQNISGVINSWQGPVSNPVDEIKRDQEMADPGGWT